MDTSNLQNMISSKKKDYLMNFVLPESIRLLSSKLQIKSTGKLGKFQEQNLRACNDSGKMTIPSSYYSNQEHDADFILFAGSFNLNSDTIAYASACSIGKIRF